MQYPVPQFIESEAKIIYFLTFKQFFIIVGGGAIIFTALYTVPFKVFLPIAIITGIAVMVIGFLRIDGESVVSLFLHYVGFTTRPRNYTWKKDDTPYPFAMEKKYEPRNNVTPSTLKSKDKAK